jgi:hypothetical protein
MYRNHSRAARGRAVLAKKTPLRGSGVSGDRCAGHDVIDTLSMQ